MAESWWMLKKGWWVAHFCERRSTNFFGHVCTLKGTLDPPPVHNECLACMKYSLETFSTDLLWMIALGLAQCRNYWNPLGLGWRHVRNMNGSYDHAETNDYAMKIASQISNLLNVVCINRDRDPTYWFIYVHYQNGTRGHKRKKVFIVAHLPALPRTKRLSLI